MDCNNGNHVSLEKRGNMKRNKQRVTYILDAEVLTPSGMKRVWWNRGKVGFEGDEYYWMSSSLCPHTRKALIHKIRSLGHAVGVYTKVICTVYKRLPKERIEKEYIYEWGSKPYTGKPLW